MLSHLWEDEPGLSSSEHVEASDVSSDEKCKAEAELRKYKNKAQTANARARVQLNRQAKALQQSQPEPADINGTFLQDYFATRSSKRSGTHNQQSAPRAQAIYSYLKAFVGAVVSLFQRLTDIDHIISTNVFDDTDVAMSLDANARRSKVPVMNNVQDVVVGHSGDSHVWFHVHQPFMILHGTKFVDLYNRFCSWLLFGIGTVGFIFALFGLGFSSVADATLMVFGVCRDALKTNSPVIRELKKHIAKAARDKRAGAHQPHLLCIDIKCLTHQFGLLRKDIALAFSGYWPNVVRLGHLFESCSFRKRFKKFGTYLVVQNFKFILVPCLPEKIHEWLEERRKSLGMDNVLKRSRPSLYTKLDNLIQHDNGDPDSLEFIHWSTDHSRNAKQAALTSMIFFYLACFGDGFDVPLLYRWKHGEKSQRFVSDTWLC